MIRHVRFAALALVLATTSCLSKCRDKKVDGSTALSSDQAAGSLISAAREQGAFLPPELADPKYADENTLPMGPFKLPPANFSTAATEREPNNTEDSATVLGPGYMVRGETRSGDYDTYTFEISGEPQLWAIEATGRSIGNVLHRSGSSDKTPAQQLDTGRFVIPNLYLAPGKHWIEVRPTSDHSGPYTLRVVPLGKPDLRMEREPNNEESYAHPLRPGIPRAGLLLDTDDKDHYSFALREPGHIALTVTSPPDVTLRINVYGKNSVPSYTFTARSKGEKANIEMMLPPGEYVAAIRSTDKGSVNPYKVKLEQLDPFAPPVDREPNNEAEDAAPLPADLVLKGSVGEYSDYDWYRLPTLSRETTMRIQVLGMSGDLEPRRSIQVVSRTGDQNQYLNWASTDSIWEMKLPAGKPLFFQLSGQGAYQLRLSFSPGIPPIQGSAAYTVSLPAGPHLVEAFSAFAQQKPMPVKVRNPGSQPVQLAVDATTSHNMWTITPARQMVTVDAGKEVTVPFQLSLPPDAGAGEEVQIAVRATSATGSASATTKVYALCGAVAANAQVYTPLPAQMLGGLNLASLSLGGKPVAAQDNVERQQQLYDGVTPNDRSWRAQPANGEKGLTLTVSLAGDRAASIAGVTLTPTTGDEQDQQVNEFDVLVSEDGESYRPVMSGRLRLAPMEQPFAFPQPVRARFAQLKLRSNHSSGRDTYFALGEWKVIASPGEHPFEAAGFNIADPSMGGHVVWSQPNFPVAKMVLSPEADVHSMNLDPANLTEWVVGFRHNRAAQISRMEWAQPADAGSSKLLSTVEVSVSTGSPIGPWIPVGTWKVSSAAGSTTPLELTKPVWARFVRFSTSEPRTAGEGWRLAEAIRIYERGADASYRSALGEWGQYSRSAIYERVAGPRAVANAEEVNDNGKRDDAKKIDAGKAYRGRVIVGEDEDWYKVDVPRDHNRLKLNLQGDPMLRAVALVQDESGKPIAAETKPAPGGIAQVEAIVEGGKTYYVKLTEPPRSIALVWDNSGSVTPFSATLYRALGKFVEVVQPRKEFVNLMPFQDREPKFLLSEWSDQPYILQGAVQGYARKDGSSNAELNLLAATRELENREGSKAILFLTDAASDGYDKTSEVWAALSRVPARVFAVELHIGDEAAKQQQMMRDWADSNDGNYSTFRTSQDIDMAFERTSCMLRRPARYSLSVETRFEEPPSPGALEVVIAPGVTDDNAVEIILDASGSMLQMLGNRRRMDIARSTLTDLVEKTLPAGTPFAFRAFGTRLANCESDLLLKVQPLDRAKVGAMVRKLNATNLAKTPIGASLRAVAEDLKGVKGQKVVVLLTDGEETCGGDPPAALQYLKSQGLDVRVNIVGFAVDEEDLKSSFERWAEIGGGRFFDAKNAQELTQAMNEALRPKFQVTDATGSVIAEGTAGGAAVDLPIGTYTVRVLTSPVRTFDRVTIASKQRARIDVK